MKNNENKTSFIIQIGISQRKSEMGQCTGCSNTRVSKPPLNSYWKEPDDTEKYSNIKLPQLQFQVSLANFKIKKCAYPAIAIKIEIKGVEEFHLRQKKIREDQSAKWSFEHKFGLSMTEYELRKTFLRIQFQDEKQAKVGQMLLNLYLVSTGPYHQDFAVNLKKGQNTRINFDIKISQIIQIQVQSILAQIDLLTKHPGQKFIYSIKTIVGHNLHLNNSSPSYTVRVMLDNKEKQTSSNSLCSEKKIGRKKKKEPEKQIDEGKNLVWKKEDNFLMPSVTMKILVSEIHHSYFQILLWKIDDKCTTKEETETPELYGQCYVALHKLFDKDPKLIIDDEGKQMEEHIIDTYERIWNHGKNLGNGMFKFSIRNEKYIKQMQVCVQTEEGIMKYSPFIENENQKGSLCAQLKELVSLGEEIQSNVISLDKLQTLPSVPNIECRKLKVSIEKLLEKIVMLLKTSSKKFMVIYSYSSEKELLKAQKIFIELGLKTVSYLEEEDVLINELCWQILIALIRRGEFLLAHIGFDQKEKQKIKNNEFDKKLNNRIEVALLYKQFIYDLLSLALKALNVKGLEYERNFAQIFCACAYFRIPNFRIKLLDSIEKNNDPEIQEWRGIEFNLQDDINYDQLRQEVNTFTILCDWNNSFHKCLDHEEKSQVLDNYLIELLKSEDWRFRMSKRGIAFFYFVKYWVEYIESIAVNTKDIQWKYFPGYNKLIKCFLVQLKKRSILQYPDALKQACYRLLSNEKLLNSFVLIVYGKADINRPLTIIKAIEFINQLFLELAKSKKKIPATFNYGTFFKGLQIILESDFSFAISKTMIMIYNNFNLFNLEFRKNISMYFLGKSFFSLFLHWSHNVRDTFYYFLIFRVYRESMYFGHQNEFRDMAIRQEQNNEQIRNRYQKLMLILENAEKVKQEEDKMNFHHLYEKDLYKKLRKKIYERKKRKKNSFDFIEQQQERKSCPNSPGSQEMTSSTIFQEKYSIRNLSKKRESGRFQSQILKPKIQLINKTKQKETQSQFGKNDDVQMGTKKQFYFKHEIYDTTQGKRELISGQTQKMNQFDQGDFQIGSMDAQLIEYLPVAMRDFKKINEQYREHVHNKDFEVPSIKIAMPLDGKEIKPEKIDDW